MDSVKEVDSLLIRSGTPQLEVVLDGSVPGINERLDISWLFSELSASPSHSRAGQLTCFSIPLLRKEEAVSEGEIFEKPSFVSF